MTTDCDVPSGVEVNLWPDMRIPRPDDATAAAAVGRSGRLMNGRKGSIPDGAAARLDGHCHSGVQTKPPCDKTPLVRLNPVQSKLPSFYCEYRDRNRQINSSRCILCTSRRTQTHGVGPIYYSLMKTLNTSSGDYTAIFYCPFASDAQSDRV